VLTAEIREFRLTDLDGYVEMSNSSCRDDPDFKEVTAEDVRRNILDSADYRPEGHFVAVEGDQVFGKGRGIWTPQALQARGPVGWMELLVEPALLGTDVEKGLFEKIKGYLGGHGISLIQTRVDTRYESRVRQLERLGFVRSEYQNHGMERDPKGIRQVVPPEGFELRVARIPEELEAMLRVFNQAFATRDRYVPLSMERFRGHLAVRNPSSHSGVFLAVRKSDGELVGMVMSNIDQGFNSEHHVRRGGTYSLAVIPSERRKGLGTALLLKSIEWIGGRGMDTAHISVNVANPDALSIYSRAGYKTVQVYQGYEFRLG
jgi:GNAT superfamily N-acetyltransferase